MSIYYITETAVATETKLPSYNMVEYSIKERITSDDYATRTFSSDITVIYDLRLALNKADSTINNNKVWNDIGSNSSVNISSLIIYADETLNTASWKNIIFKKDDFPEFPSFSSLIFDGPTEDAMGFYNKVISVKITGWGDLSKLTLGCFRYIYLN